MWYLIKNRPKTLSLPNLINVVINLIQHIVCGLALCVYYCIMYCVHADAHTDGGLPLNDGRNENVADSGGEGENPRRSSSMDCLSDPNLWPRSLSSTNQVRATYLYIQVQPAIVYIGGTYRQPYYTCHNNIQVYPSCNGKQGATCIWTPVHVHLSCTHTPTYSLYKTRLNLAEDTSC